MACVAASVGGARKGIKDSQLYINIYKYLTKNAVINTTHDTPADIHKGMHLTDQQDRFGYDHEDDIGLNNNELPMCT